MKKTIIMISVGLLIVLLSVIGFIFQKKSDISFIEKSCSKEPIYYTSLEEKDIYLDCVESVQIKKNGKDIELKDYLTTSNIDTFIQNLEHVDTMKDGGSVIYKKGNLYIVRCHNIIDINTGTYNNNIYITTEELYKRNNVCEDYAIVIKNGAEFAMTNTEYRFFKSLLDKYKYTAETCDGISTYDIQIKNENFGIEIYDKNIHIRNERKEIVLSEEDTLELKKIMERF